MRLALLENEEHSLFSLRTSDQFAIFGRTECLMRIRLVHAFFSHSSPLHPESGNEEKDGEAKQSQICHLFTDLFIILVIREIESHNLMRVERTEELLEMGIMITIRKPKKNCDDEDVKQQLMR